MVDRIVLDDPVTPNDIELECECLDGCGKFFTYIEAYTKCSEWMWEHSKDGYNYYVVRTDCTNPREGDIVAYVDYHGAILCSIYAIETDPK